MLLLAQLLRGYKSAPRDLKSAIGAYIAENLTSVTLPETARAFGYNPKYFSGLFRKLFGKNFVDIVRDSRLDYAATLVGFTDYSVEKSLSSSDTEIPLRCTTVSDFVFRRPPPPCEEKIEMYRQNR